MEDLPQSGEASKSIFFYKYSANLYAYRDKMATQVFGDYRRMFLEVAELISTETVINLFCNRMYSKKKV